LRFLILTVLPIPIFHSPFPLQKMTGIKVIFGGAMISSDRVFKGKDDLEALLASLKKYGVKAIDTAQTYGDCEQMLGSVNAGSQFIIDTKWKGGIAPGSSTKENIVATAEESMKKLKMDKVRTSLLSLPFLVLLVPIK
jgi:diketogulonate reductase-like aldo/keto reductase